MEQFKAPPALKISGKVENRVKIIQCLLRKAAESDSEVCLALLNYRAAPVKHGVSPADTLFS